MNVIWRTLFVIWRARRALRRDGVLPPTTVTTIALRTLPTDIDILGHMNNGRYLSLFDLGRWDSLIRAGIYGAMKENGWYAVVSNASVTFRKSLALWQEFAVESRFWGHDEKGLYLEQRAVVNGEVYARLIVRARILRRSGGTVSHEELFTAIHRPDNLPDVAPWVLEWAKASALPPTKAPAPSTWD